MDRVFEFAFERDEEDCRAPQSPHERTGEKIELVKYQEILNNIFMISMKSLKKSCRVSSPEGVAALFVCGLIGLSMVVLVPENEIPESGQSAAESGGVNDAGSFPSDPRMVSGDTGLERVDIKRVIDFCITHTTASRSFVVFRNGTCVLVKEPCEDPVKAALGILKGIAGTDARFLSEQTAEGDLVVTFKGSVFHWIPGEDIASLDKWYLANSASLLSEQERGAAAPGWVPAPNARLGLIARKRLLEDAASKEIVKILRPNTSVATNGR